MRKNFKFIFQIESFEAILCILLGFLLGFPIARESFPEIRIKIKKQKTKRSQKQRKKKKKKKKKEKKEKKPL